MSGVVLYWGEHLEYSTHLSMNLDHCGTMYVPDSRMLHVFIESWKVEGKPFIVLIDGVPYDWNLECAQ